MAGIAFRRSVLIPAVKKALPRMERNISEKLDGTLASEYSKGRSPYRKGWSVAGSGVVEVAKIIFTSQYSEHAGAFSFTDLLYMCEQFLRDRA